MTGSQPGDAARALSSSRRRIICRHLVRLDADEATVDDLVRVVAEVEGECGAVPTGDRREEIEIDLHHAHLPMLADLGVVEYDPGDGTVTYRDDPVVEAVLEELHRDEELCV